MKFESTDIDGVVLVTPEQIPDDRGFFAQTWGQNDFEAHGLQPCMLARNLSYNRLAATLRGMHFQRAPHAEVKEIPAKYRQPSRIRVTGASQSGPRWTYQ